MGNAQGNPCAAPELGNKGRRVMYGRMGRRVMYGRMTPEGFISERPAYDTKGWRSSQNISPGGSTMIMSTLNSIKSIASLSDDPNDRLQRLETAEMVGSFAFRGWRSCLDGCTKVERYSEERFYDAVDTEKTKLRREITVSRVLSQGGEQFVIQ